MSKIKDIFKGEEISIWGDANDADDMITLTFLGKAIILLFTKEEWEDLKEDIKKLAKEL